MTPEQRINEFTKRQVWYESSVVVKLNAVNGLWYYSIYAWTDKNVKFLITMQKYNGEDPADLIQVALLDMGIKNIKLGVAHV